MLKYRNFGKKSLNEIKDKLIELKLGLGLTFEEGVYDASAEVQNGVEDFSAMEEETVEASEVAGLTFDD